MNDAEDPGGRNRRLGLILFTVYAVLYGGFVFLAAFAADVMQRPAVVGLNLAVVYGFGLIVAAVILALVYGFLCRGEPTDHSNRMMNRSGNDDG